MNEILNQLIELIVTGSTCDAGVLIKTDTFEPSIVAAFPGFNFETDTESNVNLQLVKLTDNGEIVLNNNLYKVVYHQLLNSKNTNRSYSLILLSLKTNKKKFNENKIQLFVKLFPFLIQKIESQLTLKKSEERFRTVFETVDDFIFVLDAKGSIIFTNNSGALALEYIPEELIGMHFLMLVEDSEKGNVGKFFQELLKSDKVVTFEVTFKTKYNKTIVFDINARSTFENEKIESVVGIGRNVTSRKAYQVKLSELNNKLIEANRLVAIERDRANQRISVLEELNRLKNEFVSSVSHELRTPLASIIGFAETIDSDPNMDDSMKNEFNHVILSEAKRLAKLINDVLDLSKIESGKIAINKTRFNIIKLLNGKIIDVKEKCENKNLFFSYDIPEQEILIFADEERINQVFDNIFSNAIKFTNPNGRISLLLQILYKEVEIIVTDTGVGIPQKDLPFLYQKFYRVERLGNDASGTGLGLALVKQIIDLHKGMITIKSEEQKGTTIIIKLPRI
jgi:PAS domain S-box-containing protein